MTGAEEVPTLTLGREDMMRTVMSLRTLADVVRRVRENRGRAAWDDEENAERLEAAALANGLRKFTPADAAEWDQGESEGRVSTEGHPDSGMTVRVAPLSGGRFGVQAGWEDHHTATVVGSQRLAEDIRAWLRENSTEDSVNDLRAATGEAHEAARTDLDRAEAWARQTDPRRYESWESAGGRPDTHDGRRTDDADLIGKWKKAQAPEGESNRERPHQHTLADRVRGRVPESVVSNPRWTTAEEQFTKLVDQGADPTLLADSVSAIDFADGIRSPSGFAAWTMRDVARKGRAHGPDDSRSEEHAKREVAEEWLGQAEADNPLDRARAARLVGHLDRYFDGKLFEKYPDLADVRDSASSKAEDHDGRARTAQNAAAGRESQARSSGDRTIVIDPDGTAVLPFEPFTPTEGEEDERGDLTAGDSPPAARADAADPRAYAASETDQVQHDRADAAQADIDEHQPTEPARRAAGPLESPTTDRCTRGQQGAPGRTDEAPTVSRRTARRPAAQPATAARVPTRLL